MGHDIYVTAGDEELHYARYGAGEISAEVYYEVFNAEEHNGGCSGEGESIEFDRHEFKEHQRRFNKLWGPKTIKRDGKKGYTKDELWESLNQITESIEAIQNYFQRNPPKVSDYKYFLIKNTNKNLPQCISQKIVSFAATEPMVTITFG